MAPKLVGPADYYIMHSWQAGFAATVKAVHRYVVQLCKRKAEDVYCWMVGGKWMGSNQRVLWGEGV